MKMMAECNRLDGECAGIYAYFEQALARDTSFISEIAALCAEACFKCADACKKIA